MQKRRRFKQTDSLQDRLAQFAQDMRVQAAKLAPGPDKDALLKKAGQADTAMHADEWAYSPGLRAPK